MITEQKLINLIKAVINTLILSYPLKNLLTIYQNQLRKDLICIDYKIIHKNRTNKLIFTFSLRKKNYLFHKNKKQEIKWDYLIL